MYFSPNLFFFFFWHFKCNFIEFSVCLSLWKRGFQLLFVFLSLSCTWLTSFTIYQSKLLAHHFSVVFGKKNCKYLLILIHWLSFFLSILNWSRNTVCMCNKYSTIRVFFKLKSTNLFTQPLLNFWKNLFLCIFQLVINQWKYSILYSINLFLLIWKVIYH